MKTFLTVIIGFLAALAFSSTASALTKSEVQAFQRDCRAFEKVGVAKQASVAATIGFTTSALNALCRKMLTHSLAQDERISRVPNGHYTYRDDRSSGSPGSPSCSTDSHGRTSCSYEQAGSSNDLNCGSASPGSSTRCTGANGIPSNVSCYTDQSGYTSCN